MIVKAYDDPRVREAIDAARFLSVDAIQRANSGHPGAPLALAPLLYRLYTRHMKHDPAHPGWPDRDRFVLSNGHASMILYATLHLSGYDISIEDIKNFRQWGSKTPGHPEYGHTPGVETTTGPLGQGFANAVGLALAEAMAAERFNLEGNPVFDHFTYCTVGDGDLMEGIASEAASLAGFVGLGKLIVFYDDNAVSLSGPTSLAFGEYVQGRFQAYGWHVTTIEDVNDLEAVDAAVAEAKAEPHRPTLVITRTHIGYGSPVQDTFHAHGSPLGEDGVEQTRERLGWDFAPFEVPDHVYEHWRGLVTERAAARARWRHRGTAYEQTDPKVAAECVRFLERRLPEGWADAIDEIGRQEDHDGDGDATINFVTGTRLATRVASGTVINHLAVRIPELVGGAADLAPSTKTKIAGSEDLSCGDYEGRNIEFGVREHGMGAIANGIVLHSGFRCFNATFFTFSEYMGYAVRMAAMMRIQTIFVFTHDSIGLGEDGPTHQPIEQLAWLRAMPGIQVIRPADANETAQAWKAALEYEGPTALVLSRQDLPVLDPARLDVSKGATVIADGDDAAIIGTGSEVSIALDARDILATQGLAVRVISMPCWELFDRQPAPYREAVLPPGSATIAVEAAAGVGWERYADAFVGMHSFGASAPAAVSYAKFGITPEAVADAVTRLRH